MQYSKSGLSLTEQFEGCRLESYQDSGGVWTIGYGHTRGITPKMRCTIDQAVTWLLQDIDTAVNFVNRYVQCELSQHEFDALVDFTFNVGGGNLKASTLLKLVNEGRHKEAAEEFHRWDKCKGVEVAGLLRRRLAEREEFLKGDDSGS